MSMRARSCLGAWVGMGAEYCHREGLDYRTELVRDDPLMSVFSSSFISGRVLEI